MRQNTGRQADRKADQNTMRIAFVVNSFPALSETFILDQIAGLIDLGHDVHILSLIHISEPTRPY